MTLILLIVAYAILLSVVLARRGHQSTMAPPVGSTLEKPVRILVVGATGGTGRQLVTQALERGYAVTAFVRDPARVTDNHPLLTVIRGNVLDYPAVEAAVQGQDAVLCALGHKRYWYPTRILSEGTQNILRAMEDHRIKRLVCETSLGIGDSAGRMGIYYTFFVIPFILPFYFWDKTRQEGIIAKSHTNWIIVRPTVLTNGRKTGSIRHGLRVGNFLWTTRISRADVAGFMLDQLTSGEYLRVATGVCSQRTRSGR